MCSDIQLYLKIIFTIIIIIFTKRLLEIYLNLNYTQANYQFLKFNLCILNRIIGVVLKCKTTFHVKVHELRCFVSFVSNSSNYII